MLVAATQATGARQPLALETVSAVRASSTMHLPHNPRRIRWTFGGECSSERGVARKTKMNLTGKLRVACGIGAAAVALAASAQAGCNELTAAEKESGWRLLFDGKSTAAWRGFQKDAFPSQGWVIEGSCLKCEKPPAPPPGEKAKPSLGGDIITTESFDDFEFSWEWKLAAGANSGVKYFVDEKRADKKGRLLKSAVAHEYQMLDDAAWAKHGPKAMTASWYEVIAPKNAVLKPLGEFNQSRIVVQGQHVEHWLNGAKVVEYETDSAESAAGIAASKFKDVPGFAGKIKTPILLQDHGGGVWFRNLKIRELPAR